MCLQRSGAARVRGNGAASGAAKLPGGAAGQVWSLCEFGAPQDSCQASHGLPVQTGSQQWKW